MSYWRNIPGKPLKTKGIAVTYYHTLFGVYGVKWYKWFGMNKIAKCVNFT